MLAKNNEFILLLKNYRALSLVKSDIQYIKDAIKLDRDAIKETLLKVGIEEIFVFISHLENQILSIKPDPAVATTNPKIEELNYFLKTTQKAFDSLKLQISSLEFIGLIRNTLISDDLKKSFCESIVLSNVADKQLTSFANNFLERLNQKNVSASSAAKASSTEASGIKSDTDTESYAPAPRTEIIELMMLHQKGEVTATLQLGLSYFYGEKVVHDKDEAFKFISEAYNAGNVKATAALACCYRDGVGTEQNITKAEELFSEARTKGIENPENFLSESSKSQVYAGFTSASPVATVSTPSSLEQTSTASTASTAEKEDAPAVSASQRVSAFATLRQPPKQNGAPSKNKHRGVSMFMSKEELQEALAKQGAAVASVRAKKSPSASTTAISIVITPSNATATASSASTSELTWAEKERLGLLDASSRDANLADGNKR